MIIFLTNHQHVLVASMLQYSSLTLAFIVIVAYHKHEPLFLYQWLIVLCTSLINHTTTQVSNGMMVDRPIQKLDIGMCHINAVYAAYRTIIAPMTQVNMLRTLINSLIFGYVIDTYHISQRSNMTMNHASIHIVTTIGVINTMFM
jgi:hypothetical protein